VTAIVTGLLFLERSGQRHSLDCASGGDGSGADPGGIDDAGAITEIHWTDPLVAVPAFLTLVLIPFTYSIANGLGFGIIAWRFLHLAAGKFRREDWLLYC